MALALSAGCELKREGTPPSPLAIGSQATPAGTSQDPVFAISSEALAKEYEIDAKTSDARYRGKWGTVEGTVDDVHFFSSGRASVTLKGFVLGEKKSLLGHVARCEFVLAALPKVSELTKGQKLKFKGKCDGERGNNFVDFSACEVLEIGPDPAIRVSAEQLTKDYVADEKAADAGYKDKYLLVDGTVVQLKEKGSVHHVILEGHDEKSPTPVRVSAAYAADRKEEFAHLKKGSKVKIKGECGGRFLGEVVLSDSKLVN
jgi:hypothetical protein